MSISFSGRRCLNSSLFRLRISNARSISSSAKFADIPESSSSASDKDSLRKSLPAVKAKALDIVEHDDGWDIESYTSTSLLDNIDFDDELSHRVQRGGEQIEDFHALRQLVMYSIRPLHGSGNLDEVSEKAAKSAYPPPFIASAGFKLPRKGGMFSRLPVKPLFPVRPIILARLFRKAETGWELRAAQCALKAWTYAGCAISQELYNEVWNAHKRQNRHAEWAGIVLNPDIWALGAPSVETARDFLLHLRNSRNAPKTPLGVEFRMTTEEDFASKMTLRAVSKVTPIQQVLGIMAMTSGALMDPYCLVAAVTLCQTYQKGEEAIKVLLENSHGYYDCSIGGLDKNTREQVEKMREESQEWVRASEERSWFNEMVEKADPFRSTPASEPTVAEDLKDDAVNEDAINKDAGNEDADKSLAT